MFTPLNLAIAYVLDLVVGDPAWMPHPVRWIGHLITRLEKICYNAAGGPAFQRAAGFVFWTGVVVIVTGLSALVLFVSSLISPILGAILAVCLAYTTIATRNLHQESVKVVRALREGNIQLARERLAWIVSRDTSQLDEREILRAVIETVSENISDGVIAPLFYLALGGPVLALAYKAVNTMDSMVGYLNDRYRYFGWFAARADDVVNWIPSRLSGVTLVAAAACLGMDARGAWHTMLRDAGKMKSPNAGYPEAAAAGALGVRLGGTNIYFGEAVEKPTLGDPHQPITLATYKSMIRLMYSTSLLFFVLALVVRYALCRVLF